MSPASSSIPSPPPLRALATTFLRIGLTVYGGMWGGVRQLERELVERHGWLEHEALRLRLVLSTLMPSPRFIGLAGLVGFQLRGWLGGVVAVFSLLLPSSLLVLAVVMASRPGSLLDSLAFPQRFASVAVVGILLGNAWRHAWDQPASRAGRWAGIALAVAVAVAVHWGAPMVLTALGGLAVGWVLLRREGAP